MNFFKKLYSAKQKCVEIFYCVFDLKKGVSAYMFHRVTDTDYPNYRNLTISVSAFEKFIVAKKENGWYFARLSELEDEAIYNGKTAVITFDDMYEDAFKNAVPILNKYNIPFTVFIATELVDKPEYITSLQLQNLKENTLCTVAAHSISHKILRCLSVNEKEKEISKEEFIDKVGFEPQYFAYPYGTYYACDKKSQRLVCKNGYRFAFSTLNYSFNLRQMRKKPYFIPRININNRNYLYDGNVIKDLRRRK